jgi:hypothetical protein
VNHGIVDVFAYQEALLIEAVFAVALLVMVWAGFRRWLQLKEKMGLLIAEQTAERAAQNEAQMERVEGRLTAIEQAVSDSGIPVAQIGSRAGHPLPEPTTNGEEI